MLLRTDIHQAIRSEILACRLPPGADIREQALASRLQVSRQPVREALLRLEQEGLVTVLPRQGYRVNAISVAAARDLLGFRAVLEPACARRACAHAPAAALADLDRFRAFEPGSVAEFIGYNRDFHVALARCCDNRRMRDALREIMEQSDRLVLVSVDAIEGRDPGRLVAEHGAIIDAVQARDGRRAAKLLREHVGEAEKRILAALSRAAIVTDSVRTT